ncbi:MAG: hypothetical protein NZ557_07045 [Chthonomonadaceae bacterium]|nr:hypothetical protein [Chthonomonadaceae bacterium]
MKQQISPPVAIAIIAVVIAVAIFALTRSATVENRVGQQPPGMPPEVQARWNEITGGKGASPGGTSIPTAPGANPAGAPGGTSIPTGPPTGR